MSFDSFLDKVKYYGKIFLAGFIAGLVAFIVKSLVLTRAISITIFLGSEFYIFGATAGMVWLLTGIIDDLLQQVSFMKSFYNQMEPVYYSILGPVLLAAVLGVMIPISNIFIHTKVFTLAIKYFSITTLFKALFAGFESKYKYLFIYYTIRVTLDSIAKTIYKKYLASGKKNVRLFIFTLVAAASAGLSSIASYPLRKQFNGVSLNQSISTAISDAIIMLVMTPTALLISDPLEFKFIEFVGDLC